MHATHIDPALEAELAWRHELIRAAAQRGTRHGGWFRARRRRH